VYEKYRTDISSPSANPIVHRGWNYLGNVYNGIIFLAHASRNGRDDLIFLDGFTLKGVHLAIEVARLSGVAAAHRGHHPGFSIFPEQVEPHLDQTIRLHRAVDVAGKNPCSRVPGLLHLNTIPEPIRLVLAEANARACR